MRIPGELRYTETHEWVRDEGDGVVAVGISDYAQDHLGELVYVELPKVGAKLAKGAPCAVVESTKAASDVYAPVSGEVVSVNGTLAAAPQTVNGAPYDDGWLFRLKLADPAALTSLATAEAYEKLVAAAS
jgi:glycine cleavage system H protein